MTTMNSKTGRGFHTNDEESDAIVYQGASMSQLAKIFSMDQRDIKAKLGGNVNPCGHRRNHPIYQIRDVAPYLVAPPYDMDEFIQRMSHADLPPILRKEYWAARNSQQNYEIKAGELWPTSEVMDVMAMLLKNIRTSLLITRESVERETELTPRQRTIITNIIDSALESAHATTVTALSKAKASAAELQADEEVDADDEEL